MKEQTMKPRAREDDLIVQELEDETLVYDLGNHKAHCLNRAAAAVWRLCDGTRDEAALARLLGKELAGAADEDVVRLALRDLAGARLLREPLSARPRISRRRLIQRLGQAAALPLVVSIVSPTAAQAASCRSGLISPSDCNAGSPAVVGCCCNNHKICLAGGSGCAGARC
jgi:coenzyme PQQ synthesis protein D (PqqD)